MSIIKIKFSANRQYFNTLVDKQIEGEDSNKDNNNSKNKNIATLVYISNYTI